MGTRTVARPHQVDLVADDRDRVVDLLRAASLLVVALGHWLLAGVWVDAQGGVHVDQLLAARPWAQWLTWGAQVIGLFMLAGAYANATSWRNHRRRGGGYGAWLAGRFHRLLGPTLPLIAVWIPLAWLVARAGLVAPEVLRQATQVVAVPLWFLAVYVLLVAATPGLLRWHDRHGTRVLGGLVVAAVGVEVLSRGVGVALLGWLQFPLVWGAVHQLGFFWQDGSLRRAGRRVWVALAVTGFGGLLLVTRVLDVYPLSMVGVPGDARSNNSPPSLAVLLLATGHLGIVMLAHRRLATWLHRSRVWAAVRTLGAMSMSVYLWHLTAMVAVLGLVLVVPGGPRLLAAPTGTSAWWLARPLWLVAFAFPTLLVVRRVLPVERATVAAAARLRGLGLDARLVVAGTLLACAAMAMFAVRGFTVPGAPFGLPVAAAACLAGALLLVRHARRRARHAEG